MTHDRLPLVTLGVAACAAACAAAVAAVPALQDVLIGSRAGILRGELWRLLTSHVVHASTYHLGVDLAAWLVLGAIYEPRLGARFSWIAGGSALAVGAGVAAFRPDVAHYAGLSGVIAGVWTGGAAWCAFDAQARRDTRGTWIHGLVLAAAFTKILAESLHGSAMGTAVLGAEPLPLAHVLGALGGLTAAGALGRPQKDEIGTLCEKTLFGNRPVPR